MRPISAAAALSAAALGLSPAVAHAENAPPVARAAWIKGCYDKTLEDYAPCGHWRLLTKDGRQVTVHGAATRAADANGDPTSEAGAFAISADGRVLAYERAGDGRLVVQRVAGGPAKVLPKPTRARGADQVYLALSPAGDRVLVDYDEEHLPSKVITVATGRAVTLPAAYEPLGFSADGDELLASRALGDNTTALYAHRLAGGSTRRTPPLVIANAHTYALDSNGTTVAAFTSGPRIRTYDLKSGELSAGADLPFKKGTEPTVGVWDADGRVSTTISTGEARETAVVRVLTVDPATGEATQADKYSISRERHSFVVAGE
ncbi:hypothetical protein SAMN05444920_107271 [Nonomuraea solani]|uniref:WD40-like Beta Propeller Repeat n=1 Tax=Nonomuraea solani TaxID=1144553 RepID=A0A1H6E3J6_9ACTN|nr:hypothetical protein [Nonomuraea solani]SEG91465.1 hypothetical protein SAMN05444920_107271 [Nonomuraea solani]